MYREVFPSRLKNARSEAGYTQREVAAFTEIPLSTIAKYETNKLEPDLEKLGILCDCFEKKRRLLHRPSIKIKSAPPRDWRGALPCKAE